MRNELTLAEYLVGASSRIARAYSRASSDLKLIPLTRIDYLPWLTDQSGSLVAKTFDKTNASDVIHIFAAVTDPNEAPETIELINNKLPEMVYRIAEQTGSSVFTYGTVLESQPGLNNNYVASKRKLVLSQNTYLERGRFRLKHLRLRTVFGVDRPQKHMFLGQMLEALENDTKFLMSSGRQLREYQSADWVANQIRNATETPVSGVLEVSNGVQISLAQLATGVFNHFDRLDLLEIGALPDPEFEIYPDHRFDSVGESTDSVVSIIDQVSKYLQQHIRA
jgi:hypothetical protein